MSKNWARITTVLATRVAGLENRVRALESAVVEDAHELSDLNKKFLYLEESVKNIDTHANDKVYWKCEACNATQDIPKSIAPYVPWQCQSCGLQPMEDIKKLYTARAK